MANKRLNPRLAKMHLSYSVEDVASLYKVHKNTIRNWIKQGLPTCDDRRPTLILGRDLRAFLEARRTRRKRPCGPGEMYCFRCRLPKRPTDGLLDFDAGTGPLGNLVGLCPNCGTIMNRRINVTQLHKFYAAMGITSSKADRRISGINHPSVNCDLSKEDTP